MAIVTFGLQRGWRGKVGSYVFQKNGKNTVSRERTGTVANPQSYNQMLQRVVFATVTQAADKLLPIIGISQQGVTNETESRRRWISQNVKKLRDAARRMQQGGAVEAAFAPKGNTQLIPNSYQISKGSLSLVIALVPKTDSDSGDSFAGATFRAIGTLYEGQGGTFTALQLWKMLFGLEPGDQLTFPQIYGEGIAQALTGAGGVYLDKTLFTDFVAPRIVLKTAVTDDAGIELSANTTSAELAAEMIKAVDEDATWYDVETMLGYKLSVGESDGKVLISSDDTYDEWFAINNDDPMRAIGCIRSHKDVSSRQWQYSTSDLVCVWEDDDRGIGISDYFGFTLANAIDTYKKNVILDSDGNFLQRGTDDNIVPPSFQ